MQKNPEDNINLVLILVKLRTITITITWFTKIICGASPQFLLRLNSIYRVMAVL